VDHLEPRTPHSDAEKSMYKISGGAEAWNGLDLDGRALPNDEKTFELRFDLNFE
jgi:hypothetical protein